MSPQFENPHPNNYPLSAVPTVPTVPTSTQGTSRSGRGAQPETPQQLQQQQQRPALEPGDRSPAAAVRRNVEEERDSQNRTTEVEPDSEDRTEVDEDQRPFISEAPEAEETEQMHPHPSVVEPLLDHSELNVCCGQADVIPLQETNVVVSCSRLEEPLRERTPAWR